MGVLMDGGMEVFKAEEKGTGGGIKQNEPR